MFLRAMDAHRLELLMLPAERRRFLAAVGRRSTNQSLVRREPLRRHPILLAVVSQCAVGLLEGGHRAVRPGGVRAGVPGKDQDG